MRRLAMLLGALFIQVAQAQTQPPQAPAATPARPTPPTRAIDGPGAPPFTKIPVGNAPLVGGDFVIGPDCSPAPELTVKDGVPAGHVLQFTMESKDSKFYPGIARDGTPDPKNPRTLVVETHPNEYQRTITVYVPAQYRKGSESPLIVTHDGPKLGEPDTTGDRDLYNPNVMRDDMHDWVAANHRFAAALKSKGNHNQYVFALDSSHCDRRVREQTPPAALELVWKMGERWCSRAEVCPCWRGPRRPASGLHAKRLRDDAPSLPYAATRPLRLLRGPEATGAPHQPVVSARPIAEAAFTWRRDSTTPDLRHARAPKAPMRRE